MGINRSFSGKKPFFLWEKAVLSLGKSRSFSERAETIEIPFIQRRLGPNAFLFPHSRGHYLLMIQSHHNCNRYCCI